jgi:hypothetical protein
MKERRKSSGNMLGLVVLTMGLIIAVGVIGFIFNSFLFQRTQAQYKVDALAISLASKINAGNRVGQMNELIDRCRELVYVSSQLQDECSRSGEDFLNPLCQQLVEESHEGQALVERERKNQIQAITTEIQAKTVKYNADTNGDRNALALRWLQTYEPKVVKVELGRIADVQSNVKERQILTELADFDRQQNYVEPTSQLFRANINARLPAADGRLDFKIAALPAYTEKTCTPARNVNSDVFIPYGTIISNGTPAPASLENIPTTVQIVCTMDATVGPDQDHHTAVSINSTGTTNGAFAEPE